MIRTIFKWLRRSTIFGLALTGALALVLTAMMAVPVSRPPMMQSVINGVRTVDRSDMPPVSRFQARDGTELAYRHYPPGAPGTGRIAIVVHGSSGGSPAMHAVSRALAAKGVEAYAVDMRGHGASGTRGDVAYIGQLEDDLADLVRRIRRTNATAELILIGHSAGGGFSLRVAGSPLQNEFARTILLAPYLGYDAPTTIKDAGGWASADIPRIVALLALRKMGIECCESLPVVAFATPPNSQAFQTSIYSYRLMRNFAVDDYRHRFAAATKPVSIYAAANDEMMVSANYAGAVKDFPRVDVHVIEGIDHMGTVSDAKAAARIAEDVATRGSEGS
jgi:alpha-beta hydrolase superfamily lysophospholipase